MNQPTLAKMAAVCVLVLISWELGSAPLIALVTSNDPPCYGCEAPERKETHVAQKINASETGRSITEDAAITLSSTDSMQPGDIPTPDLSPCEKELSLRLNDADYVRELCRYTGNGFIDQVCNTSLERRRKGAWYKIHECEIIGEGICDTIRNLHRRGMFGHFLVKAVTRLNKTYPDPKGRRPLTLGDVQRLIKPPLSSVSLSDTNTCDVRFWLGQCPIPPNTSRLIVVSRGPQNRSLAWLDNVPDVPKLIYTRGHVVPGRPNFVYIPGSFGNEASVYIKFFLDCWHQLPEYTAFLHDHRASWHNSNMDEILKRVRWGKYPYISLNLRTYSFKKNARVQYLHGSLPNNSDHWYNLAAAWPEFFEPELGPIPEFLPAKHHCAQFVAGRGAILQRSRRFWLGLFGFLMRETMDSFWSGRCVEHTWSYTLGGTINFPVIPMCDMLRCD